MATAMPHPTPRTGPWRWALLGAAVGLLLAAVLWAPARWLAAAVAQLTQGRVLLQAPRGTVWSGDALLSLGPGHASTELRSLPSRLHWRWGWSGLGLRLALSSACCTPEPLQWRLAREEEQWTLRLDDQRSTWPLSLLAGLGAPWNTLQAEGQLQWHSQNLRLAWQDQALRWQGQTELQVQDLASRLSTLRPMGSYRIVLTAAAGGEGATNGTATPELTLSTQSGPLRLVGQGQWLGQRLRFTGEASADEGAEAALSNLLNIIGRREGPRSRLSLG